MSDLNTITLYSAEWCGHCTRFADDWNKIVDRSDNGKKYRTIKYLESNDKSNVMVYKDCKDVCEPAEEGAMDAAQGYPTIMINGKEYEGPRDVETLVKILEGDGQFGGAVQRGGSTRVQASRRVNFRKLVDKYKAKYLQLVGKM